MKLLRRSLAAGVCFGAVIWLYACTGDDAEVVVGSPSADGGTTEGGAGDGGADAADGGCDDTTTSEANCGTCGHACKSGVGCFAGRCGNEILDLAAGNTSTCAVLANHQVYCWGDNSSLQVGDPSGVNHNTAFHIVQDSLGNAFGDVEQVAVGETHACARTSKGTVFCWGSGAAGQLALQATSSAKPIQIPKVKNYRSIAVGGYQTCGIDSFNTVYCWGGNAHDALGHAQTTMGDYPCSVPEGTHCNVEPLVVTITGQGYLTAESIGLGRAHGCALVPITHAVRCWGLNDSDQLGVTGADSAEPLLVSAALGATALAIGGRGHSCALRGGKLECWGVNTDGEIGTGSTTSPVAPTTAFGALTGVQLGGSTAAVLCAFDTKLHCAGFALFGTVGNGSLAGNAGADQTTVIDVVAPDGGAPLTNIVRMAAGGYHVCVATADQQIYCWGDNGMGQIGNGESGSAVRAPAPSRVLGLP